MKRGNDNGQLRADEVEALNDEESEEQGTFQRASAEEIAKRRIVKIKRPMPSGTAAAAPSSAPVPSINPFSSFGGLVGNAAPPVAVTAAVSNPFANFSGLVATPNAMKTADSAPTPALVANPFANFSGLVSTPAPAAAPTALVSKIPSEVASAPAVVDAEESELKKKLRKLNSSFLSWTSRQIDNHPLSSWKDGVEDYIKYSAELAAKFDDKETGKSTGTQTAPAMVALKGSTAPAAPAAAEDAPVIKITAAPAFDWGAVKSAPAPVPVSSASHDTNKIEAPTAKTSDLLFFGAPVATSFTSAAPFANPFSFKPAGTALIPAAPATTAAPSFGGFGGFGAGNGNFSFPTVPAAAPAAATGGEDEEGGDEEGEPILEPEKVLKNENDTDEILFDAPCKLFGFNKESKEWKDTGKGGFRITRAIDTKKQRMIVRNPIGKLTFNAGFYKGMKIEKVKGGLRFNAFVVADDAVVGGGPAAPAAPELKGFMIKLKENDVAVALDKMEAAIALCN